ncbi:polyphosphate kinase [Mariniphaga anaerophila]|uniref:Polyphosphate kinase n=1 Tax=Mariniphaga anaerophila TaxID=1484053 RepID=A0A1M5CB83_9BACT|nr:polyphosphate kinase 1 [Mariniphaga anaerophila]SHF51979.1 polyphosphate kinase [Mariniphaga anaerophila]
MYSNENFINREISWLSFNERVLQEAKDPNTPLFERIRFIGIFSNNLDEFFRVRVATVRRMVDIGKDEENLLGNFTPRELHDKIQSIVYEQQEKVQQIFKDILAELNENDIFIVNEKDLSREQGIFVKKYFYEKVLPNLVPIMLSKKNKFPYLRDRSVYLAVKLMKKSDPSDFAYSLIRIPGRSVSRFFVLPKEGKKTYVMLLDDVIRYCFDDLFFYFDYDMYEAYTIKMTRDAELDIDDDISKSFIEKMSNSLKKRKKGKPVRLIYDREIPKDMLDFILKKMKLDDKENAVPGGRYHNRKDFMSFPEIGKKRHYYTKLPPFTHKDLPPHTSILRVLRRKDVMLHYPYQTFNHFIDFLREAAIDPQVKEIGITIYRVAPASRVVNALLNAVRNGKNVTVVIELQARFDEEANIMWSNKLQEEGANVINGVPGMKVHSKLAWVKRDEEDGYRNYAYIGTGNFHEGTAKVYADDGLLTADPRLADEVEKLFGFFKQNYQHYNYKHLVVSPFFMRDVFTENIEREIELAKAGKNAWMVLKMNSLIDPGMMVKLYKAAKAGVKIDLIVRGIFGLQIDRKKLSENINAISIVDKYLEHSRIFLFGNDGDEKMYISSADWMPRNLNRRIEVACPVYDENIREELKEMLKIQLRDNTKARILDPELQNRYNKPSLEETYRAQEDYYNYIKKRHHTVMKIYHNPRCTKSRAGLQYLEERGFDLEIIKYLNTGLSEADLREIVEKSGKKPFELVRTQEADYKEKYKGKELSDDEWIKVLVENPKLLQRPIVVNGNRAVLANPPEVVEEII